MTDLEALPEDWERAIAVVAHPDDLEYGAASAISRWASQGKDVRYILATRGEAGIDSMPPSQAGPLREKEQEASAEVAGASSLEFLGIADGFVLDGPELRERLVEAIRRHRPDVIIGSNYRQRWGARGPWNHRDHRELGEALPDAVRDAANRWLFTELGEPWTGVRWIAYASSTDPTHAVDVTASLDTGIASLRCHETYLAGLDDPNFDPDAFLRTSAATTGPRIGVEYAVAFELVPT